MKPKKIEYLSSYDFSQLKENNNSKYCPKDLKDKFQGHSDHYMKTSVI
jgi:hypothetical protein